jgi:activating signal cointegrator 1
LKAIGLNQPWAQLLASRAIKYDTRTWTTPYLGPMAIHAGLRWNVEMARRCYQEPLFSILRRKDLIPARCRDLATGLGLPLRAIVAVAELVEIRPAPDVFPELSSQEQVLGDFGQDRWAWKFANIVRLIPPISYPGRLRVFEVDDEIIGACYDFFRRD